MIRKNKRTGLTPAILLFLIIVFMVPSVCWAAPVMSVTDIYAPTSLIALQATSITVELYNYGTEGNFELMRGR